MVGLRVVHRIGVRRVLLAAFILALAQQIAVEAIVFRPDLLSPASIGTDSSNYYAAGQRLNAGHPLYALSAGDRDVPLNPPYWTVPLLSPPPIAVFWRPLALAGDPSMWAWWAATIVILAGLLVSIIARATAVQLLAFFAMTPAIALTLWSGNVNALIVAAAVLTWRASAGGRPLRAGALVALVASIKLTPIFLVWWFVVRRDTQAVRGFVITGLLVAAISIAGAGLQNHLDYLAVMRDTAVAGATAWSVTGFLMNWGVDGSIAGSSTLVFVCAVLFGVWLLRARPRASFALAVALVVYSSPVVMLGNLTLLLAAVVPWERPRASRLRDGILAR